jgi:hypothetical protein
MEETLKPKVRATGILIEDGKILVVEQNVTESQSRSWCPQMDVLFNSYNM